MKTHLLLRVLAPLIILSSCVGSSSPTNLVNDILNPATQGFPGCVSATAVDNARIKVEFKIPENASEFYIYRNGTKVASFSDPGGTYSFIDMDLIEGVSYSYRCEAKILNKIREGESKVSAYTIGINTPTFNGISKFSLVGNSGGKIEWQTPSTSNPAVDNYKVFYNAGPTIDTSIPPTVVKSGSFVKNIFNLGDELTFVAAVKACTFQGLCDSNEAIATIKTPDTGAPKSGRITKVTPSDNKSLIISAPWTSRDGGLSLRTLYISTAEVAPTNLDDYIAIQSYSVQSSQRHAPPQELRFEGVLENTNYHFAIVDTDPSGNKSTPIFGMSYETSDLTPPVFPGITSLERGTPENLKLTYKFNAISSQPSTSSGASFYKVYVKSSKFPSTASSACEITNATIPYLTIRADLYTAGTEVIGTINAQERTNYSVCIYAEDAAGNKSGGRGSPHTAENKWTKDLTAPSFTGIRSLIPETRSVSEGVTQRFLKVAWDPSPSDDLSEYRIKIWKNSLTFDEATSVNKQEISVTNINSSFLEISNIDFRLTSSDTVYAFVEACDDSDRLANSPALISGSLKNCTNLGEVSKKMLVLPNNIDPPRGFFGIQTARVNPDSEGSGVVTFAWDPQFNSDYAGFTIYEINPNNVQSLTRIKTCPCNGNCQNQNSCTVENLLPRKTYFLKVEAYNSLLTETSTPHTTSTGFKSFITQDLTSPIHVSPLNSVFNDKTKKEDLIFSQATDNQFIDQRVYEPGTDILSYLNQPYDASITYEVYRKKRFEFSNSREPFSDTSRDPDTNELLVNLVKTLTIDSKNPPSGILTVSDPGQTDGVDQYYTVCARDSSFSNSFIYRNRSCNGFVKKIKLQDITKPTLASASHTQRDDKLKKWSISFTLKDNITPNNLLLNNLFVYRLSATSPDDKSPLVELLSERSGNTGFTKIVSSENATAVNAPNRITLSNLLGPQQELRYISYRIVVNDVAGNTQELIIKLNFPSDNRITATLLGANEIKKTGGQRILIKGTGFSRGSENGFGAEGDTSIRIGPVNCGNISVISSEYIECSFGNELAEEIGSPSAVTDNIAIINPDGSSAYIEQVNIRQNLLSVCDDSPITINSLRPRSYTVAPTDRTGNNTSDSIGGSLKPYILCDIEDFEKAMEYDLFANRYTYLKLGGHIDMATLRENRSFGLIQGTNYNSLGINTTTITAKLDGANYGIFNFRPTLTNVTPSRTSLYRLGTYGNQYNQKGFGLFSVAMGSLLIKDIHFIKPIADLTIAANSNYNSVTELQNNPAVAFGFLAGAITSVNKNNDTNTFTTSASSDIQTDTVLQDRKTLIHNVNVISGIVNLSTSGTFVSTNPIVGTLNNLVVGGIIGASSIPIQLTPPNSDFTSTSLTRATNSIYGSRSELTVNVTGVIPLHAKIGGIAGVHVGRISNSSSKFIFNPPTITQTQAAPLVSGGIGGLIGDFGVSPYTCSAQSGLEAQFLKTTTNSGTTQDAYYCGLKDNTIEMTINLPTTMNIGGVFGTMRNTNWGSDGNQAMNLFPYRFGLLNQAVSGSLKCSTNCGGLWGGSITRSSAGHQAFLDDPNIPSLMVRGNDINLVLEGYRHVSGLGSIGQKLPFSFSPYCSSGNFCDRGRVAIERNTVEGEIKCSPEADQNTCSSIGGLMSTYSRICSVGSGTASVNQGTALEIYDNIIKPRMTITTKGPTPPRPIPASDIIPSGTTQGAAFHIGGMFGSYSDAAPCGTPATIGASGFKTKIKRNIASSDITMKDSTANLSPILTNYHWFTPSMTTTTGLTEIQDMIYFDDIDDGVSEPPAILSSPSYTIKPLFAVSTGKGEGEYPESFDFDLVWGAGTTQNPVIPYLR